jgi:hypothetical protein
MNTQEEIKTEKRAKKEQWIYDETMRSLLTLDVKFTNGIIRHPTRQKCSIKDLVTTICAHRLELKQTSLPRPDLQDIIIEHVNKQKDEEMIQLRQSIAYDPSVKDEWNEYMKIVFNSTDELDRIILQHCIWILKRRLFGYKVDSTHQPLFLNIYGPPNTGKTSLLNNSLLNPIPEAFVKAEADISSVINDEKKYFNLGEYFAIKFGEMGGMKKVDVEKFKYIIDEEYISPRALFTNSNDKFLNIACLWSTSNKRISSIMPEVAPRKWYELEMFPKTAPEMEEYIRQRDLIDPVNLYRCIDESSEKSEMMKQKDAVIERIIDRCGYMDSTLIWIAEKFGNSDLLTGTEILVSDILKEITQQKSEINHTAKSLADKFRQLNFELRKTKHGVVVTFTPDKVQAIVKRVNNRQGIRS